jgi:hypothetical protein
MGDSELNLDNVPDVEDMVSVCAGLVVVDDESNIIRLVHYTTQEYFEHIRESWNPEAEREIASACLTYLSFETFASGASSSDGDFKIRISKNAFFEYAATNWARHILTIQEELSYLALQFLQDEALLASTSQMVFKPRYTNRSHSQAFPRQMTGLHLTARNGLLFLLEELLRPEDAKILTKADSPDGQGRTPLSWAARGGHEAVMKLLQSPDNLSS